MCPQCERVSMSHVSRFLAPERAASLSSALYKDDNSWVISAVYQFLALYMSHMSGHSITHIIYGVYGWVLCIRSIQVSNIRWIWVSHIRCSRCVWVLSGVCELYEWALYHPYHMSYMSGCCIIYIMRVVWVGAVSPISYTVYTSWRSVSHMCSIWAVYTPSLYLSDSYTLNVSESYALLALCMSSERCVWVIWVGAVSSISYESYEWALYYLYHMSYMSGRCIIYIIWVIWVGAVLSISYESYEWALYHPYHVRCIPVGAVYLICALYEWGIYAVYERVIYAVSAVHEWVVHEWVVHEWVYKWRCITHLRCVWVSHMRC